MRGGGGGGGGGSVCQPGIELPGVHQHRHSVVNRRHVIVCAGRDDHESLDLFAGLAPGEAAGMRGRFGDAQASPQLGEEQRRPAPAQDCNEAPTPQERRSGPQVHAVPARK